MRSEVSDYAKSKKSIALGKPIFDSEGRTRTLSKLKGRMIKDEK